MREDALFQKYGGYRWSDGTKVRECVCPIIDARRAEGHIVDSEKIHFFEPIIAPDGTHVIGGIVMRDEHGNGWTVLETPRDDLTLPG